MKLVDNPRYRNWYPPAECAGCGTGLEDAEVFAQRRHQVTDISQDWTCAKPAGAKFTWRNSGQTAGTKGADHDDVVFGGGQLVGAR
jgi:hypothetical protein